jgi:signal transduction histidine kinase
LRGELAPAQIPPSREQISTVYVKKTIHTTHNPTSAMNTVDKNSHPGLAVFIQAAGGFVIFISLLGLARWMFETPAMVGSLPSAPAAKVNGLICGLCFGGMLLLSVRSSAVARRGFRLLAVFAVLLSGVSLIQDILGINFGIDELFIKDNKTLSSNPGRMAAFASTGFVITGSALLVQSVQNRKLKLLSKAMLNGVTLFCFFILITYLYQVTDAHQTYASSIMSVPACFALLLISGAASMLEPETGLSSIFFGNKLGNQIARLLFPFLILMILAEGFGQVLLSRYQGINEYFGIALLLFSFILTCLGIIAFVTFRFNRLDDERNIAMQQLLIQNEELKQFSYITSHDLQEPLRTIQGYTRFLMKEPAVRDKGQQYLEGINESAGRMSSLIHALLHYHLLGRKIDYEPVSVNTLWRQVIQDVNTSSQQTNAVITATTPLPVISGSVQELRQLFQNLVSNGIKFRNSNLNPRIELSVREMKDEWLFAIKDNGIGIPAKYREKVFQMFQRLHSADDYEGSGIGLSYCKKIVELHKGKIWIEDADNGGTVFCFTISKNIKAVSYA